MGRPPGRGLGGDLGDAVGAEEGPHPVIVPELVLLGEHVVAEGLVDTGGRAVEEGRGVLVVLHQPGQAPAVGLEVEVPVVGLGHGEVDHVVGIPRQAGHVAGRQVDGDAADPRLLEPGPGRLILEAGGPHHLVLAGQGQWPPARPPGRSPRSRRFSSLGEGRRAWAGSLARWAGRRLRGGGVGCRGLSGDTRQVGDRRPPRGRPPTHGGVRPWSGGRWPRATQGTIPLWTPRPCLSHTVHSACFRRGATFSQVTGGYAQANQPVNPTAI